MGLQMKIVAWAGACLLATAATVVAFSAIAMKSEADTARADAVRVAEEHAGAVASERAAVIREELDAALDAARTLAEVLSGVPDETNNVKLDRDGANNILKNILMRNPRFLGVYTCWEPNAFDGRDAEYADSEGHDSTGRLIPYWNRNAQGEIVREPLVSYEVAGDGDYYLLPKNTETECLINPYVYPVQGKPTLLTSLVVPIMVDGTFYGIAGVDIGLGFLQEMADDVEDLYEGDARIVLLSNDGTIAGFTGQPELVGKHLKEVRADSAETMNNIQTGEAKVAMAEGELEAFVPLNVGKTTTPWAVNILVPEERIVAQAVAQSDRATAVMWQMLVIGVGVTIAALVVLSFVARSIAKPLKSTFKGLKSCSTGELRRMGETLKGIIAGLDSGATQVRDASAQVSSSSQALAGGASEQSSALEKTAQTLQQMSAMTSENASKTKEANNLASQAQMSASDGQTTMTAINESSEQINKIIKVIEEIAFQTNLLALNAAVEAARAGEHGKGFAVVAEEVRNLAQRSAQAAKEITALISTSVETSKKGVAAINAIVEGVSGVAELLEGIAQASEEHSQGVSEINLAVSEMDSVTQQNAASAEESASASEELSAQAESVTGIVRELSAMVGGGGGQSDLHAPTTF